MSTNESTRVIRWGILGTARIASKVGRALHFARGSQLRAVASRDTQRAAAWISRHTAGHPTADPEKAFLRAEDKVIAHSHYRELLQNPEIDAVYIPLPPSMHCEWTCAAAASGKHVLCEKPLALNLAEAQQMVAACQSAQRQLMDGVMWYHHERTAAMKSLIDAGTLGPLRHVSSTFAFNGLADMATDNIRFRNELGGGVLGDVGWYCITAALWAFGALPERVQAMARYDRGVDINLSALLMFPDDRSASFHCGFDETWRKWFEIAGEIGSIVCDDFVNPWDVAKARFWVHDRQGQGTQHVHPHCIQEVRMVQTFCELIRSGRLDPHWPQISLDTQRVCDAIATSAREEKPVTLS